MWSFSSSSNNFALLKQKYLMQQMEELIIELGSDYGAASTRIFTNTQINDFIRKILMLPSVASNDISQVAITVADIKKKPMNGSVDIADAKSNDFGRTIHKTKGLGDCGFHAILGKWNGNQYECKDISNYRKQLSKAIREAKEGSAIFTLVKAGIEAFIMDDDIKRGPLITKIRQDYVLHIDANAVQIGQAWLLFQAKLNGFSAILKYIQQTVTEQDKSNRKLITAQDIFQFCLNKSQGNLRCFIQLESELNVAFTTYQQITNAGFPLNEKINQAVISEYADYLEEPGHWLLPLELNLIAQVFNRKVVLHTCALSGQNSSQLLDTFNHTAEQSVEVQFNGSDHYERVTRDNGMHPSLRGQTSLSFGEKAVIQSKHALQSTTATDSKKDSKEQPISSSGGIAVSINYDFIIPLLTNPVLIHKYAAQFKRIAGLIAYGSTVEYLNSIKTRDGKSVSVISTATPTTDLEAWNQKDFMAVHLRFLIELYVRMRKGLLAPASLPIKNKTLLEQALGKEIWITANALAIYGTYRSLPEDKEKNIAAFVGKVLDSLAEVMPTMEEGDELVFPCGTESHAMYISLVRYHETALLRLDNLGQGIDKVSGLRTGNKVKPYVITQIPITELAKNQALRKYFEDICLSSTKAAEDVLNIIYNLQSRIVLPAPTFKDAGYPELEQQTIGNCVVENFKVGMQYRLAMFDDEAIGSIFEWMVNAVISAGLNDQKSSEDNIFAFFRAARKKNQQNSEPMFVARLGSAEPRWSLPLPLNNEAYFIGRQHEIEELGKQFNTDKASPRVVLSAVSGLGGVGKTQLATYYIHHPKQRYKQRLWFHVETQTALSSDCLAFARQQGLIKTEDKLPEREIILVVKDYLERTSDWLAVYDNAGKYQDLKDFLPQKGGHIIITTRHQEWRGVGKKIDVGVFSKLDAIKYLKNVIQHKDWNKKENTALEALAVTELGCLPLALAQAGAYIQKSKISIVSYLELYHKRKLELLADQTLPPDSKDSQDSNRNSVATTWAISLEAIQNDEKELKQEPVSISVLHAMAYLYSDNIPRLLLEKWLQKAGLAQDDSSATVFLNRAVMHLTEYSMIQANQKQESVSAHRLVQEVIRLKSRDDHYFSIDHLFLAINDLFEIRKKEKAYAELWVLKANLLLLIEYMDKDITKYEKTLNEALLLTNSIHLESYKGIDLATLYKGAWSENNTLKLSLPFMKNSLDKSGLFSSGIAHSMKMGIAYNMKKIAEDVRSWQNHTRLNLSLAADFLTNEEREILLKSTEIAVKALEEDKIYCRNNPEVMVVARMHVYAMENWLGKYQEAVSHLEKILPELVKIYGEDNQLVAIAHADLGVNYRECGLLKQSIAELSRALATFEKNISGHPQIALTQMDLAVTYLLSGHHDESKKLYERALPIIKASVLKDLLQREPSLVKIFEDYMKGLKVYRIWHKAGISTIHGVTSEDREMIEIQQRITTLYSQKVSPIHKSFNAFVERLWVNFVRNYKAIGQFNLSWVTGWRYPDVPRLRGEYLSMGWLLGRGLSAQKPEDLFKDIMAAADLACNHSPTRGICYFWISPSQMILLLTNPSDIAQVLKVHSEKVSRKIPLRFFGELLGSENIFLKQDHEAREQRAYLNGTFWDNKSIPIMQKIIGEQLAELDNRQAIDLNNFFTRLTLNVFAKCHLGVQELSQEGVKALSNCITEAFSASIDFRHFSKLLQIFNGKPVSIHTIKDQLRELFKKHLLSPNHKNILAFDNIIKAVFTEISQDDTKAELLSEQYFSTIYSKACTLLIAGHETTAITFQFAIKLLAKSPDALRNLRQELSHLKQPLSYADIDKLEYLRAIIKETLRLYPPSGFIPRGVDQDFTLIDAVVDSSAGYKVKLNEATRNPAGDIKIKRGDMIFISPYITHHRADLWPDPEMFIPERHLSINSNEAKQITIGPQDNKSYSYIPFGAGDRACIGWKFAERELMLALATLYSQYDVIIEGGNNFDIVWQGTFKPKHPTLARFLPITKSAREIDDKTQQTDGKSLPVLLDTKKLPASARRQNILAASFYFSISALLYRTDNYPIKIISLFLMALTAYEILFSSGKSPQENLPKILVLDATCNDVSKPSSRAITTALGYSLSSILARKNDNDTKTNNTLDKCMKTPFPALSPS